jgi:hypothetical protein
LFGLEFRQQLGRRGKRDVDGGVRDLQQKSAVLVLPDEIDRPLGEELGRAAIAALAGDARRHRAPLAFHHGLPALILRAETRAAQVPLAEIAGRIIRAAEPLGKCFNLER